MRLRLFTPLRAKITSSAQSLVPPSGRPSQESSLPILTSFNHLIGAREQHWRYGEAEHPGCFYIDDQFELRRLHDGQVRGFYALKDAAGIGTRLAKGIWKTGAVAHQPAGFGIFTRRICGGDRIVCRQSGKLHTPAAEEGIAADK